MKAHKLILPLLALFAVCAVTLGVPSCAAAMGLTICDPTVSNSAYCLHVNSDGSINARTGDSNGLSITTVNAGSDAQAASGYNILLPTRAAPMLFNGSTFDRAAGNTTGGAVLNGGMPAKRWNYSAATSGIANTTTAVTIKAAAGAGIRNCIADIEIDHDALGGASELVINDGAAGTALIRLKLQTTASEGRTVNLSSPICGTANTLMEVKTVTAVTGGVYVSAQGYTVTP